MKSIKKINTTKFEIIEAQELWAQNVIEIGDLYTKNKDYKSKANIFVKEFYAFDVGEVLFKPTLASEKQFRYTYDDALSYFIGGHISEDNGFALKPWKEINFGERKITILNEIALSMGNYFFHSVDGSDVVKVEFTFGYVKDKDNNLLINLHHSSMPYTN
tara:strand:- start:136 stop:615 length:480 start_codon:yes stop_codon:yes gene_type:complete